MYFVVVCRDQDEKRKLMTALGAVEHGDQFVRSTALIRALADQSQFL